MITREVIVDQIKQVFDPEIPVNVWDLGLIYTIDVQDSGVRITMSLTSEACPSAKELPSMVRSRISQIPGVADVNVSVVWDPKWTPELISPEGRKILKLDD